MKLIIIIILYIYLGSGFIDIIYIYTYLRMYEVCPKRFLYNRSLKYFNILLEGQQ